MSAAETRWSQGLARKILRARLPLETWEWSVAEKAVKPLLAEVLELRVPPGVRRRLEYGAEDTIRETLADSKARTALERQLTALALTDLGRGMSRSKVESTFAQSAKPIVDAWLAARLLIARARARKTIADTVKETNTLLSRIAKMNPAVLHRFANAYNWDDGVFALDAVVRQPNCALGTALLVYWLGKPYWYAQWRTARTSDNEECFAMLEHIEQRIAKGGYAHGGVAFDPRKEKLTGDTYPEEPKKRVLPAHVFAATTKSGVVTFEPPKGKRLR